MITLGLDLGISSVGWAIIDETYHKRKLIAWGSRIFVPGVEGTENDICTGKGVSRCTERRLKRALRKQYLRRRERKNGLLELLTANGLLPQNVDSAFFTETDKKLFLKISCLNINYGELGIQIILEKIAMDKNKY